jgi:hypothetical protein
MGHFTQPIRSVSYHQLPPFNPSVDPWTRTFAPPLRRELGYRFLRVSSGSGCASQGCGFPRSFAEAVFLGFGGRSPGLLSSVDMFRSMLSPGGRRDDLRDCVPNNRAYWPRGADVQRMELQGQCHFNVMAQGAFHHSPPVAGEWPRGIARSVATLAQST